MLVNYYYVYIYKDYKNQRDIREARCTSGHRAGKAAYKASNQTFGKTSPAHSILAKQPRS